MGEIWVDGRGERDVICGNIEEARCRVLLREEPQFAVIFRSRDEECNLGAAM